MIAVKFGSLIHHSSFSRHHSVVETSMLTRTTAQFRKRHLQYKHRRHEPEPAGPVLVEAIYSDADLFCTPKMSPVDDIESRPGKGRDEEAIY
jgi:hypothetical protein